MMQERVLDRQGIAVENGERKLSQCGKFMADRFLDGYSLILDMDGVVVKADSLNSPQLTTPEIITSLRALEDLGVDVGVATARGKQILDYLRGEHGLRMSGPAILEGGQVMVVDGEREYLVESSHPSFVRVARKLFHLHPDFKNSWEEVRSRYDSMREFSFCPGNFQWQGECSVWFWFPGEIEDRQAREFFEPAFKDLAQMHEIDFKNYFDFSIGRMVVGGLGMAGIRGKREGLPINKGTAAERLTSPWVFAADGFGDMPLVSATRNVNGGVIGIEGNLDDSTESVEFLNSADFVLSGPEEFAETLFLAASHLEKLKP